MSEMDDDYRKIEPLIKVANVFGFLSLFSPVFMYGLSLTFFLDGNAIFDSFFGVIPFIFDNSFLTEKDTGNYLVASFLNISKLISWGCIAIVFSLFSIILKRYLW